MSKSVFSKRKASKAKKKKKKLCAIQNGQDRSSSKIVKFPSVVEQFTQGIVKITK